MARNAEEDGNVRSIGGFRLVSGGGADGERKCEFKDV